jgi:hypothetical protein
MGRRAARAWLEAVERAIPPAGDLMAYLREQRPDVVLLSPLLTVGSTQIDVLQAARASGVRTALCVASWDHLSSKARIRLLPDRVLVWNDTQAREAIELHGLDRGRLVVTGAQCFDQWFDRPPRWTRQDFCARAGLPSDGPYIFYACSSLLAGSPPEAPVVLEWIRHLRSAPDAAVRHSNVLIRPHPKRWKEWEAVDPQALMGAVVWPRGGAAPFAPDSRDEYFDSMSHASAIVGLNTSALIEGAIVGRPVHTVLLPEMTENQGGTLHFRYLLEENGGPLMAARSLDEHAAQIGDSLVNAERAVLRNKQFIDAFIRPGGRTRPATDVFVEAVERLMEIRPAPALQTSLPGRLLRPFLRPAARRALRVADGEVGEALRDARRYRKALARETGLAAKRQAKAERMERKVELSRLPRSS